ncbi:MAG: RDD family protein [Candidatus Thiodiazotropha sp.]
MSTDLDNAAIPGLFRRLGAILYDLLLLTALIFVATAAVTLPMGNPSGGWLILFQFIIFEIIPLLFFTGFWIRGGQTLGMRAWHLKVVRFDGTDLNWSDALRRHLSALISVYLLGLGFVWILLDPEKMAWHDRLSRTRMVIVK